MEIIQRPRRNRKSASIRNMLQETHLRKSDFIFPMFVKASGAAEEISSMPGIYRWSLQDCLKEVEACAEKGIMSFCFFPAIEESKKDSIGSESLNVKGLYPQLIYEVKKRFPEVCIMTDVALDPYSSDGHDGIVRDGKILNDETLEVLAKMAVVQAQAGADIIGPSDMMDGRVLAIRKALDKASYTDVSIMSYTAKYASAFYGPFRDALNSAPKFGDKKTYQMNPANSQEALLEAKLDIAEGADIIMVKPALSYLDIIANLKNNFQVPVAAYNVSGEYAMVKAAAKAGYINESAVAKEILLSIKRAGADVILSYFAKQIADQID